MGIHQGRFMGEDDLMFQVTPPRKWGIVAAGRCLLALMRF
jgi:hypothetical protein